MSIHIDLINIPFTFEILPFLTNWFVFVISLLDAQSPIFPIWLLFPLSCILLRSTKASSKFFLAQLCLAARFFMLFFRCRFRVRWIESSEWSDLLSDVSVFRIVFSVDSSGIRSKDAKSNFLAYIFLIFCGEKQSFLLCLIDSSWQSLYFLKISSSTNVCSNLSLPMASQSERRRPGCFWTTFYSSFLSKISGDISMCGALALLALSTYSRFSTVIILAPSAVPKK